MGDKNVKYKLTDEKGQTYNETQWGPGVTHSATGKGKDLCSDGWIHYYDSPLLAALMNPIGANFQNPRLWEFKPTGELQVRPDKSGCKTGTTLRKIPLPNVSRNVWIRFAILCVQEVYKDPVWNKWAKDWLSGKDRSRTAARAAAAHAADAAAAAAHAAAARAAAAHAADAAAAAAHAADAGDAAAAAAHAAAAHAAYAARAADAARAAAAAAAVGEGSLNLEKLADQAYREEKQQ